MDALKDFNADQFSAFLDILIESGVEEFEGLGLHVRFTETVFAPPAPAVESAPEPAAPVPAGIWRTPELWPGGSPPAFPKRSK